MLQVLGQLLKYPPLPYVQGATEPMPGLPSVCSYRGVVSTTTDENSSTFTNVDIGAPHPSRIVAICTYGGSSSSDHSCTVDGYPNYFLQFSAGFSIMLVKVPSNTSVATITSFLTSSLRKALFVYAVYSASPFPVDYNTGTVGAGGTVASALDISAVCGGVILLCAGNASSGSAVTLGWNGSETVIKESDQVLESSTVTVGGRIYPIVGSDTYDASFTHVTTGTKRLVAVSFAPPPGYTGR